METLIMIILWVVASAAIGFLWPFISSGLSDLMGQRIALEMEQENANRLDAIEKQIHYEARQYRQLSHSREDRPYRSQV